MQKDGQKSCFFPSATCTGSVLHSLVFTAWKCPKLHLKQQQKQQLIAQPSLGQFAIDPEVWRQNCDWAEKTWQPLKARPWKVGLLMFSLYALEIILFLRKHNLCLAVRCFMTLVHVQYEEV